MSEFIPPAFGWQRDLPDHRDYTPEHPQVADLLTRLQPSQEGEGEHLPRSLDLRWICSPDEDLFREAGNQSHLPSCSAYACIGLVEYFGRRADGRRDRPSALFLCQMTRRLLNGTGYTGAPLRATLKSMVRFGLPPEEFWPYDPDRFAVEPPAFLFSYGRDFASTLYVRLDPRGQDGTRTLARVKSFLAAGFPSVFGFTVFSSLSRDKEIAYPTMFDTARGGQAVLAVGYDDRRKIRSTKGALLIRNCWGTEWGKNGYGWLPYAYVENHLAADFWTLVNPDWLDSGEFARPESEPQTSTRSPPDRL